MDIFDAIQWLAMVVTVIAAWMVGSQKKFKRNWGFWLFLLSNVLWIIWGLHDHAYAVLGQKLHGDSSAGVFGGTVSRNLIDCRRRSATAASTCSGVIPAPT